MSGKCRPRFKGIENFLRRIAFNLGNTPSQTEVKIISCIPIDVTDLQHKILELEKELEDNHHKEEDGTPDTQSPSKRGANSVVNTALGVPTRRPARQAEPVSCACSQSSITSAQPMPPKTAVAFARSPLGAPSTECAYSLHEAVEPATCPSPHCTIRRGLFKKTKKKRKDKTHLVYYAQPQSSSPFNKYNNEQIPSPSRRKSLEPAPLSSSYLNEVVYKQFKPDHVAIDLSGSSHFSSPVCRDDSSDHQEVPVTVTGLCSCCHIAFHDVDVPRAGYIDVDTRRAVHGFVDVDHQRLTHYTDDGPQHRADNSAYYDSSLYDVVPVKETSHKPVNNDAFGEVKERLQSRVQPHVAFYNSPPPTKARKASPLKVSYKTEPSRRLLRRKSDRKMTRAVPQTGSVDFGDVYMKPVVLKSRGQKNPDLPAKIVVQKNAECLTINLTNTECQTASSKSVQLDPPPADERSTEETLNQIKSILQSVLTEVKENALRSEPAPPPPHADTRDAIVQKGASHSEMAACSSLLHSISYSPYGSCLGPYTLPAPSRPLQPSYANKCLQNYPLFIHTTGRQCACCFRSVPSRAAQPASPPPLRAHVAATNTEDVAGAHRSKETETLIKEIYKSIAVNMSYPPQRDTTSTSGGDDVRSEHSARRRRESQPPAEPRLRMRGDSSASQATRVNAQVNTSTRLYPRSQFASEVISNAASMRPRPVSRSRSRTTTASGRSAPRPSPRAPQPAVSSDSTPSDELAPPQVVTSRSEESEPSSEPDSDTTVVESQPKKKTGLFSKITRLFKPKSKKGKKEISSEDEAESDSDDYQTVYSHRSRAPEPPPPPPNMRYRRTHSKISNSRYSNRADRRRTPPYLEQEFRRHWNERIAFHSGDSQRYTSAVPFTPESSYSRPRARPVYYRQYDSRPVMVQNTRKTKHEPAKNETRTVQSEVKNTVSKIGLTWLHKGKRQMECCGRQWKDLILEG